MEIVDKIVNFAHCVNCKFYETPDAEEPCHECLNNFTNVNSHVPVNFKFKEREEKTNKKEKRVK